jgi:heparosan-N-sulfate-glucuronate 5-epimerase
MALKFSYLIRILETYILKRNRSNISFWHGVPEVNADFKKDEIGQYHMPFLYKSEYRGPFDKKGVLLLDYKGKIGKQYNPIAIAQYGLAHYNLYKKKGNKEKLKVAIKQADWLVDNLEKNERGISVWMHHFDWDYREMLKSPWYSSLAQGSGISLLARIYSETKKKVYLETAQKAFEAFLLDIKEGGVRFIDRKGNVWIEEYLVDPPTHVLNGFIWSLFGVYDYFLLTQEEKAKDLFNSCVKTLKENLKDYDVGFWSLYEQSGTKMKMMASPFYHNLHIVQLKILYEITGEEFFKDYARKWDNYRKKWLYRKTALIYKIIFKIFYY